MTSKLNSPSEALASEELELQDPIRWKELKNSPAMSTLEQAPSALALSLLEQGQTLHPNEEPSAAHLAALYQQFTAHHLPHPVLNASPREISSTPNSKISEHGSSPSQTLFQGKVILLASLGVMASVLIYLKMTTSSSKVAPISPSAALTLEEEPPSSQHVKPKTETVEPPSQPLVNETPSPQAKEAQVQDKPRALAFPSSSKPEKNSQLLPSQAAVTSLKTTSSLQNENPIKPLESVQTLEISPSSSAHSVTEKEASSDSLPSEVELLSQIRTLRKRNPEEAQALLLQYKKSFPEGKLKTESEFLEIDLLTRLGRVDLAKKKAEAWLSRDPNSPYAGRLYELLPELIDFRAKTQ